MKKYLISCLEPSANLHFGEVLKELKKSAKSGEEFEICGIFDPKFAQPIYASSEFSAMGFVEILPLIFKAKKALKQMVELAKECDGVLLIDSPAFNLPLAKALKKAKVKAKITYYILPQVWAWKPKRVEKVEKYCDNLASILPFDEQFYNRSIYVGHPLLDEIKFQKHEAINSGKIAFLPGSRRSEIIRLMPVFKELATKFKDKEKILPIPAHLMDKVDEIYGDVSEFSITNDAPKALYESEFAFVCSGTATLETALVGTPLVLAYKAKAIDMFIAKRLVNLTHVGLANIMFDFMKKEPLHEEFLQDEANAQNLYNAYLNCDRTKFIKACEELREYLKFGSAKNVLALLKDNFNDTKI
ncbi:lipid-A-disaccharide synthase [Campylobacter geochelonis]|uniref:Lipid-A-disaccharide synthase n=1 Tax=Campylobacter geochelonis TaxID=1780362 RepID=A0A128ECP9_9BACT|nr:lipid-A-disaccharide synthase [Campylobacter geochelonis]QKF70616.1 lipid A disaccharide synthase [Campylobacter geochelonis]CZE45923.1 ipid-A-disaccharide synthase [Campylobacter geochelonis]CZE50341.1 ipid-A-disaccharide synthase [Campylobacter geochelonis]